MYLIGHTKGGVGKTTVATNLAVLFALRGKRVCLVDADEQLHSNRFCARRMRQDRTRPRVDCHVLAGGLHDRLRALRGRYDHVIVDAGGADSEELRSAARTVDVMLCPFSPSQNDLDAFDLLIERVIVGARQYHPALVAVGLPNKVEPHAKRQDRLPLARDFIERKGVTVLGNPLTLLASPYNRSAETGLGVAELLEGKQATRELSAVVAELAFLTQKVVLA